MMSGNSTDGLSWAQVTFLLVRDGALEETSGLRSAGSPWFTPMLEIRTVFQELSFKKLSSPTELPATENNICVKHASHLR